MTVAIVSMILFVVHIVLFLWIDQIHYACLAALGLTLLIAAALLLRRGHARTALLIGWLSSCAYLVGLHLAFGNDAGVLFFAFPIAVAAYSVYRPEEWAWRLLPTVFALVCCAALVAHVDVTPLIALEPWEQHLLFAVHVGGALYAVFVLASHAAIFRHAALAQIAAERDRADKLLLNILPAPIAARLMTEADIIADSFDEVTVLFADIVGFTALSSRLSNRELVSMLNRIFSDFDELADKFGLEKIKTIGDAYMVVGGLPAPMKNHATETVRMAIEMQRAIKRFSEESGHPLKLRIGLHSGPVTAGVIGKRKFSYDLWGDTVNVASRMEALGEPGRVHLSGTLATRVKATIALKDCRQINVKGKGTIETWFVAHE